MPVTTVEPDYSTGLTHDSFGVVGSGTKHGAVRLPDNDDTSYIWTNGGFSQDLKSTEWPTSAASVASIKSHIRRRNTTTVGANYNHGVENASGNTTVNFFDNDQSYQETTSGAHAKPGGGSWTPSDLSRDVTWLHLNCTPADGRAKRTTTLNIVLDWAPGAGGFAFLLVSVIGGLIGGNLALRDMPGIALEVGRTKKPGQGLHLIRPDEYEAALQDWLAWTRPEFAFLGR